LHLEHVGEPGAQDVIAMVFPTIVLTVVAYGFLARPFARLIGTAQADPQGAVLVGADLVSRELGQVLKEQGFEVLLVDTNHANTTTARTSGLRTFQGSVLSHRFTEEAELDGIGNMIALTPSDEINRLALEQFVPTFGRAHLFRVASANKKRKDPHHAGRELFAEDLNAEELRSQLHGGARIRATKLTDQFGPDEYREQYGDQARPLFVVTSDKTLQIITTDSPPLLKVGQTVLGLVPRDFQVGSETVNGDDLEAASEADDSSDPA